MADYSTYNLDALEIENCSLYTHDVDTDDMAASGDADLRYYESHENAKFWMHVDGFEITGFKKVCFPDCWVKLRERPKDSKPENSYKETYFTDKQTVMHMGIECYVLHPGQHPGTNAYWLTPVKSVYAPILEEIV